MKCELISVGTELLVGDTLNTNVQFLSRELSLLARISSNGVCRPQKYSIPRFFSVTTFSHSLRFSGV